MAAHFSKHVNRQSAALAVPSELIHSFAMKVAHGRSDVVGGMPFEHTADLPQAYFKPVDQRLKALEKQIRTASTFE